MECLALALGAPEGSGAVGMGNVMGMISISLQMWSKYHPCSGVYF